MNERWELHPSFAKWLTDREFEFVYEPRSINGNEAKRAGRGLMIPDFKVELENGRIAVVECKCDWDVKAIVQLLRYQEAYRADEMWLVLPNDVEDDKIAIKVFERFQEVKIIKIQVEKRSAL